MLQIVAVGLENLLHHVAQGFALGAVVGGGLGNQQGGVHTVLVPHKGAGQEAVAFLKAKKEGMAPFILKLLDLFADELEARQCVEQIHTIGSADGPGQLGGDDALHRRAVRRQRAQLLLAAENIVEHQAADLVAGQQTEAAVLFPHGHAQTVAVRVGAEDRVRAHLVRQLDGQRESGGILGIGHLQGGKIGVGVFLLLHHAHIGDADLVQDAAHGHVAAAVKGRVDDLQVFAFLPHDVRVNAQGLHLSDIVVVHFFVADDLQKAASHRGFPLHALGGGKAERIDLGGHFGGYLGTDLRAVLGVDLVAIVLGRIMAGGDDHARRRVQMAHGVAQNGHGPQRVEQENMHAVGAEHQRGLLSKFPAHPAAVVGDDHAPALAFFIRGKEVRQTLRSPAHGIDVHPVHAHGQHAAHSRRAEAQVAVKTILDLLFIALDGLQFRHSLCIRREIAQPGLIVIPVAHE